MISCAKVLKIKKEKKTRISYAKKRSGSNSRETEVSDYE